jgi:hypothetical protein
MGFSAISTQSDNALVRTRNEMMHSAIKKLTTHYIKNTPILSLSADHMAFLGDTLPFHFFVGPQSTPDNVLPPEVKVFFDGTEIDTMTFPKDISVIDSVCTSTPTAYKFSFAPQRLGTYELWVQGGLRDLLPTNSRRDTTYIFDVPILSKDVRKALEPIYNEMHPFDSYKVSYSTSFNPDKILIEVVSK